MFSDFRYGDAADAPVVGVHFVDDDHGGGFVFAQNVVEEIGCSFDELALLLRGYVAFAGDFDVYIGHVQASFGG